MSTPAQNNQLPRPAPPTSSPSGHSELTTEGGHALSQLEQTATLVRMSSKAGSTPSITQGLAAMQLGPANVLSPLGHHVVGYSSYESDDVLVSSGKTSRFGFRKRMSALIKGDRETKHAAAITSPTQAPVRTGHCVHSAVDDVEVLAVTSGPPTPIQPVDAGTTKVTVPTIQVLDSTINFASLSHKIFPKNINPATLRTPLPKPRARIEQTTQLVHCYQLLSTSQASSPATNTDELEVTPLNETQQEWVQLMDPVEQDRLCWIIEKLVRAFIEDNFKDSTAIAEIVLLGPILEREMYRSLLSSFISEFEKTTLLDATLLQGLVQLVECAFVGYLVDDDLVRIATVLFKELSLTHNGTSDHVLLLMLALGRVLDVMVAGKAEDLNRDRDHQPMLKLLDKLRGSDNAFLKYQAAYAYQALQYTPDNETPLQVVWRYSKMAAAGASAVTSVFKLDPAGLINGIEGLQESVVGVVTAGIEGYSTLRQGAGTAVRATEDNFGATKKQSWYLALQGTALFIRQGRLYDFKQVVLQAPCRHDVNFQWGVCRQLGEVTLDPLWDDGVRQQAVDFLGDIYRHNTDWKPQEDVKRWIFTILLQISGLEDLITKDRVRLLLKELKSDGAAELPGILTLRARLPLPVSFPLLIRVQEIPKIEYDLHKLKMQRIDEYTQAVYIAPLAKPSLQAPDNILFSLMDKVEEFLTSDSKVMLILGDSGAGKSTFNRYLEYLLWQRYKPGGPIPLFINLPGLERPEKNLIAEQLMQYRFTESQIQELEQHRQLTLICDGYDESQLSANLHTTNALNQAGQRDAKLLITCRTQYLGPDYRGRFVPNSLGHYQRGTNDMFQEAVIAPFSMAQIELYVKRYAPLEPRTWVKKDYMDKLRVIPNLMDLVKNPFLLTLALEALPDVVEGKTDLTSLRITRVELYDSFAKHWLSVNKRRLQALNLKDEKLEALEDLLTDGFERNGIDFQKRLAVAIFRKQEGRPVVEYSQMRDRATWKKEFFSTDAFVTLLREASLMGRAGNQYRFIHRSILEYFFSCSVWDTTRSDEELNLQAYLGSTSDNLSVDNHLLSTRNLTPEPSIIQFLVERVHCHPTFKQHLLALIELSKSDSGASQAAANAITILVRADVRFNGADLRGICIPGADITGGQFDSARLEDSNLTDVNLAKAWIRRTDFSRAHMEGVRFGELPWLKEDEFIWSCAVSPDGNTFAAGLENGDICIYDTATWVKTQSLPGHEQRVASLAFSPSGHQLLSGSLDETVRLWNCETGLTDCRLEGHTEGVKAVAFSPSGRQVVSAGDDNTMRLWDAQTGATLFVLEDCTDRVTGIAYAPDGVNIVSCSIDGAVWMFDTRDGKLLQSSRTTEARYRCISYSSDGQKIVVGDEGGGLQLWKMDVIELEIGWDGHSADVSSVQFSPNGQWILSSSGDSTLKLWEAQTGALISAFAGHVFEATSAIFLPTATYVISTSTDETVRLWEMSLAGVDPAADDTSDVRTIATYSPDGRSLISEGHSGMLQQYDADTGELGLALHSHIGSQCVAYSPNGLQIAVAGWKDEVELWDTQSCSIEYSIYTEYAVSIMEYSPCSRWIALRMKVDGVKVWDARSESTRHICPGRPTVTSLAFSPNGVELAVGYLNGEIRVWETGSWNCKMAIKGGAPWLACVVYPPRSSHLACCYESGTEGIWLFGEKEGNNFQIILEHDEFKVSQFAYSSCGRWVAAVDGQKLHLWTGTSDGMESDWAYATTVEGFFGDVRKVTWRPNTTEFATASEDGSIRAWKVEEEKSGNVSVQLLWGYGGTTFTAPGAVLVGSVGLSTTNRNLLAQRGAILESSSSAIDGA